MRSWLVIPLFCSMMSCYALKIISIKVPVTGIESYLTEETSAFHGPIAPDTHADFRLPVNSRITPGFVNQHATPGIALSSPLFVVGDDARSRKWLKKYADKLRNKQALGLVTNINSYEALLELESLSGKPLQPVNVDELAQLLGTSHYPFLFDPDTRLVWQ